jgi:hypothetical protein
MTVYLKMSNCRMKLSTFNNFVPIYCQKDNRRFEIIQLKSYFLPNISVGSHARFPAASLITV